MQKEAKKFDFFLFEERDKEKLEQERIKYETARLEAQERVSRKIREKKEREANILKEEDDKKKPKVELKIKPPKAKKKIIDGEVSATILTNDDFENKRDLNIINGINIFFFFFNIYFELYFKNESTSSCILKETTEEDKDGDDIKEYMQKLSSTLTANAISPQYVKSEGIYKYYIIISG